MPYHQGAVSRKFMVTFASFLPGDFLCLRKNIVTLRNLFLLFLHDFIPPQSERRSFIDALA